MFKLSSAIVTLCLVSTASARICKLSSPNSNVALGQYKDTDECSADCVCMDYIPSDAEKVDIKVSVLSDGVDCSKDAGTVISQFQLSNQGTADQMSGSLDNLLPAKYCIVATLSRDGTGFVDGTCGNDSDGALIIFQAFQDVTIEASATKEVRLVMASCSEPFVIEGFAVPEFPSSVVTVSVDFSQEGQPSGSVLGATGTAEVVFAVQNHNYKIPSSKFTGNKVVVDVDNHGSFDNRNPAHSWSLTTLGESIDTETIDETDDDADKTMTSIQQLDPEEIDGISEHRLTLQVNHATKASTAQAVINTFAYDSDSDKDMAGTSDSIDFVVNPVGDLDIQIATLSAVRPKTTELINFISNGQSPAGHYSQESVKMPDGVTDCAYAKEVASENCDGNLECDINGYVVPSDGSSTFVLFNEYLPSTIEREVDLSYYAVDSDTSDCSPFSFSLIPKSDPWIYPNLPGFTSDPINYDVDLVVTGSGNPTDAPGYCKVEVTISTHFLGHSEFTKDYTRNIVFGHMGSLGCDNYDPENGTNTRLSREDFCPAISVIEWGSTDNWISAPICTPEDDGTQEPIQFCAFTSSGAGVAPQYDASDFDITFYEFSGYDPTSYMYDISYGYGYTKDSDYTVTVTDVKNLGSAAVNNYTGPCKQLLLDEQAVAGTSQILEVQITYITPPPLCEDLWYSGWGIGAVISATNKGTQGDNSMCSSIKNAAGFTHEDIAESTIFCTYGYNQEYKECDDYPYWRRRRSVERVSGCPEDSIYRCPAENNMPFQIKVEDGRLTVSMDPARLGGHTIQVETDPTGMLPTRSRFIAADFSKYMLPTSPWSNSLKLKMDRLLADDYMKQNLKPGVTTDQLVECCDFTVAEADSVVSTIDSILATEQLQAFKPRISVAKDPESNENENTNAQTTSTTTSTSTTSEKSDSSLLVVVAVAGILVLVAVIALAIFTVKNNKQSQRVVDMRGIQQSSWQKGGAMESDF